MTWEKLQKPYTGLHWWYHKLTGTKWTFPYSDQKDWNIYWKQLKTDSSIKVTCRPLNIISILKFILSDIKSKQYKFIKPKIKAIYEQLCTSK